MTTYRIVIRLLLLTLLSVAGVLFLSSCERDEFLAACNHRPEFEYVSINHHLQFPVEVHPNQVTYKVGDTLTVSMTFQDSIYDANMGRKFKIPNYPLHPVSAMIQIDVENELFISGFDFNQILIDSSHLGTIIRGRNISADNIIGKVFATTLFGVAVHENDSYNYEYKIVLQRSGRYLLQNSERFMEASIDKELYDSIEQLPFEGRCLDTGMLVEVRLQRDNNLAEFIQEFVVLDKIFSRDAWFTEDESLSHHLYEGLGIRGIPLEKYGFFCFEVVE